MVDTDYHGEIKILVTAMQGPLTLKDGEHIAQALPLPLFGHFPYMKEKRGPSSPGSFGRLLGTENN
jgi:deoxycytidine triphosphate deaminase